ncbi:MAG: glycosyltransferase 87 family protein [Chloroflexota bacterium]
MSATTPPDAEIAAPAQPASGEPAAPGTSFLAANGWPAILVIGLASAAIYATAFTFTWPLWKLYTQPQADYAWFGRYTPSSQAIYLGAFVALFALQYVAYRILRSQPNAVPLDAIVAGQIIFGILNVWIYPVAALDLYDYFMYGRIVLVYGGNPFFQPPSAFPDPLVGYSPWPNERSVYGPAWQLLSLLPTWVSGDDMLRGLVSFKLLGLIAFVVCSLVLWRLLQRLDPARAASGTLLFAWNPLLQFELVGNGHNDVVMVLFVLLALWALIAERRLLALPLLALAVLTKLLAVALGPVFLCGLLRGRGALRDKLGYILASGGVGILLAVALYAPFWGGVDTLYFLSRGNWFTASIPTMLRELLRQRYPYEEAGRLAATLVGLGYAAFMLVRLGLLWREERQAQAASTDAAVPAATPDADWLPWLGAAYDLTFVYLAFATLWWQPWYLVWLVALAALLPNRLVHERVLLFCYGGTLNYVVFKYIWPVFQPMTYTTIMGISVILIFGLPLLHLVCTAGLPRRTPRLASTPATP